MILLTSFLLEQMQMDSFHIPMEETDKGQYMELWPEQFTKTQSCLWLQGKGRIYAEFLTSQKLTHGWVTHIRYRTLPHNMLYRRNFHPRYVNRPNCWFPSLKQAGFFVVLISNKFYNAREVRVKHALFFSSVSRMIPSAFRGIASLFPINYNHFPIYFLGGTILSPSTVD